MSRLTSRNKYGQAFIWTEPDSDTDKYVEEAARKFREAVEKLARYEDLEEIDPETGLKPCPLCGGKAIKNVIHAHEHIIADFMPDYSGGAFIECTVCTCAVSGETEEQAIAAWNRRAGDE